LERFHVCFDGYPVFTSIVNEEFSIGGNWFESHDDQVGNGSIDEVVFGEPHHKKCDIGAPGGIVRVGIRPIIIDKPRTVPDRISIDQIHLPPRLAI
jgi:hypothetical protein